MLRLLLVEDDPILGKSLKVTLELEGYVVEWATTLAETRAIARQNAFDIVVLDLNLPDGSGLTFARECQEQLPKLPILMLTASSDEDSVVEGLDAGAADYVRKPFGNKELKARIRAVLKDKSKVNRKTLQFAGVTIHHDKRLVSAGDIDLELNRREFDIFCHFMANAENVVTRESLLRILNREGELFDRTIDSHVSHLRTRLRKAGIDSVQIAPVYGLGYRLEKKS